MRNTNRMIKRGASIYLARSQAAEIQALIRMPGWERDPGTLEQLSKLLRRQRKVRELFPRNLTNDQILAIRKAMGANDYPGSAEELWLYPGWQGYTVTTTEEGHEYFESDRGTERVWTQREISSKNFSFIKDAVDYLWADYEDYCSELVITEDVTSQIFIRCGGSRVSVITRLDGQSMQNWQNYPDEVGVAKNLGIF